MKKLAAAVLFIAGGLLFVVGLGLLVIVNRLSAAPGTALPVNAREDALTVYAKDFHARSASPAN